MDLNQFRVPGSQEAFYIPNFITEDEEEYLIRKVSRQFLRPDER
jgi:alkylated DNA repair protein alkB homolog 6